MTVSINLLATVGGSHCVSSVDGAVVHEQIAAAFRDQQDVALSFAGIEDVTSAFLNAAVGQLYGEFSEEFIRSHLRAVDADGDQLALLKRVVDRAKEFFRDPEQYEAAVSGALNE